MLTAVVGRCRIRQRTCNVSCWLQLLEDVGFVNVRAEDRTELFVRMLKKELKRLTDIRDEFVKVSLIRDGNDCEF